MERTTAWYFQMTKYKTILIKNIYYMLAYAFMDLQQSHYEKVSAEEFDNIQDLFAAILNLGLGKQLKQGLYREYISCHEEIVGLRGRLDLSQTLNNRIGRKKILSCDYDELSENNLFNQILKTAALLLLRHSKVSKGNKDALKKKMVFFTNIEELQDPAHIRWDGIHFQRNNQSYILLLGICRFIFEDMLMTSEAGLNTINSIMDDQKVFSHLYEKFLLEYYRKEYPIIDTSASKIQWALDENSDDTALLPQMRSDIMLSLGNKILIIDAKFYTNVFQIYKDNSTETHISKNLYQIFTYVKNKERDKALVDPKVAGLLLYAQTDHSGALDSKYHICGNPIGVKTLDLNCEFSEIKKQLNQIVEDYFELKRERTA